MHRLLAIAVLSALVLVPRLAVAQQKGAAGDWNVTFDTPQGPQTVTVTLKLEGDKAVGQLTTPMGSVPVTGTAGATDFDLKATVDVQGNKFELGLKGKVDGDALAGTVRAGDLGEFPFTGKRASASAASTTSTAPSAAAAPTTRAAAGGSDATGKWDVIMTLAGNQVPATVTLKQEGERVSGTLANQMGEVPVSGTMVGSVLKLDLSAQTPQGPLPITMTGTLSAEGFAGKLTITGMGEADWSGKRAN